MEPIIFETQGSEDVFTPFVNEECGDTMWDDVLIEAEGKETIPSHQ